MQSVRVLIQGAVMRTMSFFLTASIFSSVFIGLALASAVVTGAVHAQFVSATLAHKHDVQLIVAAGLSWPYRVSRHRSFAFGARVQPVVFTKRAS